jgi:hypothetical protein
MPPGSKNLLAVLKAELTFIENGNYRSPQEAAWRPQFIFQDSPTCLNYQNPGKREACTSCALIEFVPNAYRQEQFPCRRIPLDESGQTLDFLYRTGTEEETHQMVADWLRNIISRLERESFSAQAPGTTAGAEAHAGRTER